MVLCTLRGAFWAALCLAGAAAAAEAERVPGSVGFSAVAALPVPSPVATVRYGPAAPQFAELYLPAGSAPAPVLVLVHGGCWLNAYGLDHLRALAHARLVRGSNGEASIPIRTGRRPDGRAGQRRPFPSATTTE